MKVLRNTKVLKGLKQKIRNRRRQREKVIRSLEEVSRGTSNESSSMASINNEWQNWVALWGSDEANAKDIQGIGKLKGVSFNGNNHNKFSVLSRPKVVDVGPVLMPVVAGEDVEDGEV